MPFPALMVLFLGASMMQSFAYGMTFLLPDLYGLTGGTVGDVGDTLLGVGAMTVITAIGLGGLTRRFGQLAVLILSCLACAAGLALFGGAQDMGAHVYLAGLVLGAGWAGFYILGPIILAHIVPRRERVRYFSWLAAFNMAGIGAAPMIGYGVESAGWEIGLAFHIAALCSLLSAVAFATLRRALARADKHGGVDEQTLTLRSALRVMRSTAWRPVVMVMLGASVFAAAFNFQTIYAQEHGLPYALFFGVYTVTVIIGRFLVAAFLLTVPPYLLIAGFLSVMTAAVVAMIPDDPGVLRYGLCAMMLGIGYGLAYPIVKSMAANDAEASLQDATLQMFGLTYFIGVFCFPFVGAAVLETYGMASLLWLAAALGALEAALALSRYVGDRARPATAAQE